MHALDALQNQVVALAKKPVHSDMDERLYFSCVVDASIFTCIPGCVHNIVIERVWYVKDCPCVALQIH